LLRVETASTGRKNARERLRQHPHPPASDPISSHEKAEPFKKWLAQVGFERIQETAEPSKAIERGIEGYRKQGYDDAWTSDRLKNISAYNEKTTNWGKRGVTTEYAKLNAEMTKEAFGVTPAQYAKAKGVDQKKRKDHMTRIELQIDTLADTAAVEIMEARNTQTYPDTRKASLDGAGVAGAARKALEKQTGKAVITRDNALPKLSGPK
jgi:DNA-damage-inducible protein D